MTSALAVCLHIAPALLFYVLCLPLLIKSKPQTLTESLALSPFVPELGGNSCENVLEGRKQRGDGLVSLIVTS